MNTPITVGQTFPIVEFPDHEGRPSRLSEGQGAQPLLVVVIRGAYCSQDREYLKELSLFHPQLEVGHCGLVVITPDDSVTTQMLRQDVAAEFPFLCDESRQVFEQLGVLDHPASSNEAAGSTHNPIIPHTFLLGPGFRVYKVWNARNFWDRPSVAELHRHLRELSRTIETKLEPAEAPATTMSTATAAPPPQPGEATGNQGHPPNNLAD